MTTTPTISLHVHRYKSTANRKHFLWYFYSDISLPPCLLFNTAYFTRLWYKLLFLLISVRFMQCNTAFCLHTSRHYAHSVSVNVVCNVRVLQGALTLSVRTTELVRYTWSYATPIFVPDWKLLGSFSPSYQFSSYIFPTHTTDTCFLYSDNWLLLRTLTNRTGFQSCT